MFQWNPPKIQTQKIIGTPGLVLCASTSGKENNIKPFPVMLVKVKEHIWWDVGPFFHADVDSDWCGTISV